MREDEKEQINSLLNELGEHLDITETEYNNAVKSYKAVGEQLTKFNSELKPYSPEILPQGSFMLGTMIRPINEEDDLDIDLVCQLTNKRESWTQYDLKQKVGDQLKENETYNRMIKKPEGRRCWTLKYSGSSKYHMDILPAIVDSGYKIVLEKAFASFDKTDSALLAIRITDREELGYNIERNHLNWLKSNPFGYARWFFEMASLNLVKAEILSESIQPVRRYNKDKLPLQRVVQMLKRHRDIYFGGDENKPISVIITTLAARAYNKQISIVDALTSIANEMISFIEVRYSKEHQRNIKWVVNPVNSEENFADKWAEEYDKEEKFYQWHRKLISDLNKLTILRKQGLNEMHDVFAEAFGEKLTKNVFKDYGQKLANTRNNGQLKMASITGTLGEVGVKVKKHNFEGEA